MIKLESVRNSRTLKNIYKNAVYLLLILVLIPGFVLFEICVVLPRIAEQWSIQYFIHLFNAFFIVLNLLGNLVYGRFMDTSIKCKDLKCYNQEGWCYCVDCDCMRPPRAWHCETCNTCILKRDHHCAFLACCVGYYNFRYFMFFTMYAFIAMVYSFVVNVKCISQFLSWNNGLIIVKFILPMAIVFLDFSLESLYVLILVVNFLFVLLTGFLFFYHFTNVLKGTTTAEKKHCPKYNYDKGWKNNLIECFGSRWYLVWFCPFVISPLPGDGIKWVCPKLFKSTKYKYKVT